MSRLIDAEELENMKFSNGFNEDGILYVPFGEVLRNIRTASTAYDVEKVVEEIKEATFGVDVTYTDSEDVVESEEAIRIIRKGGAE